MATSRIAQYCPRTAQTVFTIPAGYPTATNRALLVDVNGVHAQFIQTNATTITLPGSGAIGIVNISEIDDPTVGTLTATATLFFGSGTVPASSTTDLTVAVPGASLNDVVLLGPPALPAGIDATAFVSAANVVTVRCDNTTVAAVTTTSQTWKVAVLKF
jgi:hypothetical protein